MTRAVVAAGCLAIALLGGASRDAGAQAAVRGEYVFRAAGCAGCHTDVENDGAPLAGGRALKTPFGTFYTPNITPDPEHGIGSWSEADLRSALHEGVGPGGRQYYPVFPFPSYAGMHDEDVADLFAYLRTVPPSPRANRAHDLPWMMRWRFANRVWKWLFFAPPSREPVAGRTASWNRGAYLVNALVHCGECHTPRNEFGALDAGMHLAGTTDGPEGETVPNITPDDATGIGEWSRSELRTYLKDGMNPDGDFAGSLMVDVIDDGLHYLRDDDIDAIIEYVKSVPAIEHKL